MKEILKIDSKDKAKKITTILFIVLTIIVVVLGLFIPIYSDEIEWKLLSTRLFSDDFMLLYLFPQCGYGQWLATPITWVPYNAIMSAVYKFPTETYYLRIYGIIGFLLIIYITSTLLKPQIGNVCERVAFICSLFSIGVLPFMMVLNRPEQNILLLTLLFLIVEKINFKCLYKSIILCTIVISSFAAHPKSIFIMLPFWIIYIIKNKLIIRNALHNLIVTFGVYETFKVWSLRTKCENVEWLRGILSSLTLSKDDFITSNNGYIVIYNNVMSFSTYIKSILLSPSYQGMWLPNVDLYRAPINFNIINLLIIIIVIILIAKLIDSILKIRLNGKNIYFISLLFSVLIITAYQNNKNFYESALIMTLLIISFVGLLEGLSKDEYKRVFNVTIAIGLVSNICLILIFYPFIGLETFNNYIKNAQVAQIANDFKNHCDIKIGDDSLIVDNQLYNIYKSGKSVFLSQYIFGWWATGTDPKDTLRSIKPNGISTSCSILPIELRKLSRENNGYCCVSKESIDKYLNN